MATPSETDVLKVQENNPEKSDNSADAAKLLIKSDFSVVVEQTPEKSLEEELFISLFGYYDESKKAEISQGTKKMIKTIDDLKETITELDSQIKAFSKVGDIEEICKVDHNVKKTFSQLSTLPGIKIESFQEKKTSDLVDGMSNLLTNLVERVVALETEKSKKQEFSRKFNEWSENIFQNPYKNGKTPAVIQQQPASVQNPVIGFSFPSSGIVKESFSEDGSSKRKTRDISDYLEEIRSKREKIEKDI